MKVSALQSASTPLQVTVRDFIGADQSFTAGWEFTVGSSNISITDLGIFDAGSDGLVEEMRSQTLPSPRNS
jgi:hypothetical protein